MKALGNQCQLEGFVRTARYKDASDVGLIQEEVIPSTRRSPTVTQMSGEEDKEEVKEQVVKKG